MHEQTIAKAIIEEATKHGKVESIVVEVGDLGHLPAHEMEEILNSMTDWKVTIQEKKATIECEQCSYKGEPDIVEKGHDSTVFRCPKCKAMMPKILDGDEIILKEVEVE